MSGLSDPDYQALLVYRKHRAYAIAAAFAVLFVCCLFGGIAYGAFWTNAHHVGVTCPGSKELKPGETVTISCPAAQP